MKACKRPVIPCYTRDKEGDRNEVAMQKWILCHNH